MAVTSEQNSLVGRGNRKGFGEKGSGRAGSKSRFQNEVGK